MPRSIGQQKVSHRVSVGFSDLQYEKLLEAAEEQQVSIGWVVRDAVRRQLLEVNTAGKAIAKDRALGTGQVR